MSIKEELSIKLVDKLPDKAKVLFENYHYSGSSRTPTKYRFVLYKNKQIIRKLEEGKHIYLYE